MYIRKYLVLYNYILDKVKLEKCPQCLSKEDEKDWNIHETDVEDASSSFQDLSQDFGWSKEKKGEGIQLY